MADESSNSAIGPDDASAESPPSTGIIREIHSYYVAQSFLTRLNSPRWVSFTDENQKRSPRYYPLVGILVGLVCFGVYLAAASLLPIPLAVMLCMISGLILTGALHEDGFSDFCDGFGGGWKKDQILSIMKDSRIGVYGAVGLIALFALKFESLRQLATQVPFTHFGLILISAHSLSRWVPVCMMRSMDYIQSDASKSRGVANRIHLNDLIIATVFTLIPSAYLATQWNPWILTILPASLLIRGMMQAFLKRSIGGYTGDCLGAVQQITEVMIYLLAIGVATSN